MENRELEKRHCKPCEGGVSPLAAAQIELLMKKISGWGLVDNKIEKKFRFSDFRVAMKFVNQLAEIAEAEGHHPDFYVHYNQVTVTLWTHSLGGLSENDFILAAKADSIQVA